MKISTKGRYALRMVIDLAEHADDGFISLKDIAARQGLSKKYLEQIVPLLNKTGMLSTTRGYQGGYKLAKSPSECTVGAILQTTEGSLAPVSCLEHTPNPCERCSACDTLPVWEGLNRVIMDYLDGITIQTILDQKHELEEKHRLAAEEILNSDFFILYFIYRNKKASQKIVLRQFLTKFFLCLFNGTDRYRFIYWGRQHGIHIYSTSVQQQDSGHTYRYAVTAVLYSFVN